ncbi:hypothetical protein ENKO_463 [Klebsiella phage fENko-Kae01]|nr:hypothetical protein [Klebsiella phage fENko-Kae01]
MRHRSEFIRNRTEYLMNKGIDVDTASKQANLDFRSMTELAAECVMTCADEELPGKGNTRCNRTACQSDKHVLFYNFVMGKNYCVNCATDIRFCNNLNKLDLYPEYNKSLDKLLEDNAK